MEEISRLQRSSSAAPSAKEKKNLTALNSLARNSIPYSIEILKRSSFRKKIKELLLNFLGSEDDYVEVSRLIKLFNTLG